jgi:hypothetical protein
MVRLNMCFLSVIVFDMLRNLGNGWAAAAEDASAGLNFSFVGLAAASLCFCPDSNTLREALVKLKSRTSFLFYEGVVFTGIGLNLFLPNSFLPFTLVLLLAATFYPTTLFLLARRRAKPPHIRNAMATLAITWALFITVGTFLFTLGTQPPLLPIFLPFGWQMALIMGSVLFFLMSVTQLYPLGIGRFASGQLVPDTIVRPGHRYLILHDSGKRAISFLSSTLKGLIDSRARIIVNASNNGWLIGNLSQYESHFSEWKQNGRVIVSENGVEHGSPHEGLSDRLSFGPTSTVFVNELGQDNLAGMISLPSNVTDERHQEPAEIFLLESSKAPRPRLTEFLRRNIGIELLNLSESTDPFSSMVELDHQKIRGSIILLEYDSNSSYEDVVDKFLAEGISNAELCVLFTTKSSKLYRAIKGKRMIKIIAASSLISVPDELPDGEMQIPDKELGLVAAVLSDFLDNSKNSGASFVFDSITELIRGERWEQVYSGIKQLIDLLSVPNATALFLANVNTMEPRFLGALHGAFALQLRLNNEGLRAVKIPTN